MPRHTHVFRIWLTALLLTTACATAQPRADAPVSRRLGPARVVKTAPEVYTLPNGLTVVLQEDHTSPVAAFQMWVNVGGADEPEEKAGIAHVFEHMLFKGTQKREVGQIGREISAAGGDVNAYTSNDQTVYHLVLAARYFDTGLDILADAIQNSSFDPAELEKELEVVVEEIRRGEDNPDRALGELLDEVAYKVHPYKRPVIGSKETVRSITRDDVLAFFDKWYVPNNMTLVVVGDFETAEVRQAIARAFKDFKPNPDLAHGRPPEPPQNELRIGAKQAPFQREKVALAFHIPSIHEDDAYVVDVVAEIVGHGSNSLLVDQLVHKKHIAVGVFAYSYTPRDPGMLTAGATIEPVNREEVIRDTARILFSVAHGDVPAVRLERAKTKIAADFIYRLESAQGMAGQLGYFKAVIDDIEFQERYLRVVRNLTPRQVAEVARKYIRPENMTIAVVSPEGAPAASDEALRRIVAEEWEAAAKRPQALSVIERKEVEGTTVVRLDNGTKLLITPDKLLPMVSIAGGLPGGLRHEPADQAGIANFTAAMLSKGTETLSRQEITDRLESIAGGFGAGVAPDFLTFSFSYLQNDAAEGLPLLAEILQRPTFPPEEVQSVRKQILPQFDLREDNLFQIGLLNFLPMIFGENGYGRLALGERAVVENLTDADLRRYWDRLFRPDGLVVSVVGNVDPDEFIEQYARLFAGQRKPDEPLSGALTLPRISAPVTSIIKKGKAQSHILYGWRTASMKEEDRYPLEVMNAIMAGMGGRLFLELRDRQSLAYAVTSLLPLRLETGTFIIYIGFAPDKADQALKGIRDQMETLRQRGVLEKEVEEAKRYLIGNLAVDLQSRGARASSMLNGELTGLGFRFDRDVYPEKIDAVTLEDVNRVAREYLDPDRFVMVHVK